MHLQEVLEQLDEVVSVDAHGDFPSIWEVLVAPTEDQPEILLCKLRLAISDFESIYKYQWIATGNTLVISERPVLARDQPLVTPAAFNTEQ